MVKINFKKSYLKKSPVYKDPTEILMDFTKVLSDAGMIISGLPDTSGKIIVYQRRPTKVARDPAGMSLSMVRFLVRPTVILKLANRESGRALNATA